jgi:hypothetical protein
MRQRGAVSARREPWLEKTRKALRVRSGGRCEACGRRDAPLDPAHVFGRGNKGVGEPWASCPELMAALCRECHNDIDEGTAMDQVIKGHRVRYAACGRLIALLDMEGVFSLNDFVTEEDELFAVRTLVRYCDEHKITHPDYEPAGRG